MKKINKIVNDYFLKKKYTKEIEFMDIAESDVNQFVYGEDALINIKKLCTTLNILSLVDYNNVEDLKNNLVYLKMECFFHEGTIPGREYGEVVYNKMKEGLLEIVISSNEKQMKIWEMLANQTKNNNHGNVIGIFKNVYSQANIIREHNLLKKEMITSPLLKSKNNKRL